MNILIKTWLDMCIGALVFWATGYAIAFGSEANGFASYSQFMGVGMPGMSSKFTYYCIVSNFILIHSASVQDIALVLPLRAGGVGGAAGIRVAGRAVPLHRPPGVLGRDDGPRLPGGGPLGVASPGLAQGDRSVP